MIFFFTLHFISFFFLKSKSNSVLVQLLVTQGDNINQMKTISEEIYS